MDKDKGKDLKFGASDQVSLGAEFYFISPKSFRSIRRWEQRGKHKNKST